MRFDLRMTAEQHLMLQEHLFPGDGLEAVALLLCGRRNGNKRHIFTVRKVVPVPHDVCNRRPDRITWPTYFVDNLLREAYGKELAIVKIHCHPAEYRSFSKADDVSDQVLGSAIASLLDDGLPHASLIMFPDGRIIGRVLGQQGEVQAGLRCVMVVGDEICFYPTNQCDVSDEVSLRHAQAFGSGTTQLLQRLSVAVVGCSGTGSIVVEQLARLGVRRIVLVDPDVVEEKNLNRILNSGKEDAYLSKPKVHVLASAIARMGLGTEVVPSNCNLIDVETLKLVAECDVIFGCMDGVEGRHWLNRLATFYTQPYFDVGVRLDADGKCGINQISGAVHYLQPGRSSLFSRGVYSMRRVEAEELRRTNREMHERHVREGYIHGADEDRPAVISVNMLFASLMINDFLARLHTYRNQPNSEYAYIGGNLSEMQLFPEPESDPCPILSKHVGRGDVTPFLERPF